jgi:hypothetical protein
MLQMVLYGFAERDPALAVDLALKSTPDGNIRGFALQTAFTALAQRDPEQSIVKLEGLEGLDLASAVSAIGFAWAAERDPVAALNWLAERPSAQRKDPNIPPYRSGGNDTLVRVFAEWSANSESEARAWADALPPGEIRDAVQTQLARSLAERGRPDEATQVLARLGRAADAKALADIASAWAQRDPQAAADWAIAQEPGPAQTRALAGIVRTWANDDEQAVKNWLAQFPPGEVRDRSIVSFLSRSREWPAGTVDRIEFDAWFDLIDDPWQRALAARSSFEVRKQEDAVAARAWLASLPNVDAGLIRQILRASAD